MGIRTIGAKIAWCITFALFATEVVLQVLDVESVVIAIVIGILGFIALVVALVLTVKLIKQNKAQAIGYWVASLIAVFSFALVMIS